MIVEFGSCIDPEINRKVHAFAAHLQTHPIKGVLDIVPSFTTVALHYRPEVLASATQTPLQALTHILEKILLKGVESDRQTTRTIDIPVCYGGEFGPDLSEVAKACGMTQKETIQLHCTSESVVFMIGFAPGHPYAGGLDPRLSLPRRATPRTKVAKGTVAIANGQTVIYPLQLPSGWNLIGRTPLQLFDPESETPSLLEPGDCLRFISITPEQFHAMQEQRA